MAAYVLGRWDWGLNRDDDEGHRDYTITWLVRTTSTSDGPTSVMLAAGLPIIGTAWSYGNDFDTWALCLPYLSVRPHGQPTNERGYYWLVDQRFSTRPRNRCQDAQIDNPLDEPPILSGSFVKYTKEITEDKDGLAIKSSTHELYTGDIVTFDHNKPTVSITTNYLTLPLEMFAEFTDTVNDAPMWGLPKRCVKLSNVSWDRKLYGLCNFYYTTTYEFDIDFNTFDRQVLDEGWLKLEPGGDTTKQMDFGRVRTARGDYRKVLLDGSGGILLDVTTPVKIDIKYYPENNLFLLDVPISL